MLVAGSGSPQSYNDDNDDGDEEKRLTSTLCRVFIF